MAHSRLVSTAVFEKIFRVHNQPLPGVPGAKAFKTQLRVHWVHKTRCRIRWMKYISEQSEYFQVQVPYFVMNRCIRKNSRTHLSYLLGWDRIRPKDFLTFPSQIPSFWKSRFMSLESKFIYVEGLVLSKWVKGLDSWVEKSSLSVCENAHGLCLKQNIIKQPID